MTTNNDDTTDVNDTPKTYTNTVAIASLINDLAYLYVNDILCTVIYRWWSTVE